MNSFLAQLRTAALLTLVLTVLLCGAYPLAVFAGAQLAFPAKANGSLITDATGTVRGSALLAQSFTSTSYFHPRPSAAGNGYDAANSSGTNLGPTSQKLADAITTAITAYRAENQLAAEVAVPADAVTSSASGLDPHISVANARLQAARIATARHLQPATVAALIAAHTEDRDLAVFGEPRVNVLLLNLALDQAR